MLTRRKFLIASAGLAAYAAAPAVLGQPRVRFERDPFALGVASGSPTPDSVVLWTRLAPEPLAPRGGLREPSYPVRWELAGDEAMRHVVQSGTEYASAEWGYSVHVEPHGLKPNRWYFYRFSVGDAVTPVGRTRTAPAAGAMPQRLRFAFGSCQHYEHGYYVAYRHIVADDLDVMVFLGDYVYESSWNRGKVVRQHGAPETHTLDDYRARYALYRGDPDLQAAHASCPWIVTWDDHEVQNDYANDRSQHNDPPGWFLRRRAAAYQAYYEHMPLPRRAVPLGPEMQLYARYAFGSLLSFHVLDNRQYRSYQPCAPAARGGSNSVGAECAERMNLESTYLGLHQERWLENNLKNSKARWNILAQQTLFAPADQQIGVGEKFRTDGWDGYPAARQRLVDALAEHKPSNPVFIGGDMHTFYVADVRRDFGDPGSASVASEFVSTSITSHAGSQKRVEDVLRENPHLLYGNGAVRGYTRIDVTAKELRADLRAVESVLTRDAACSTVASYVVQDGVAGPRKA